MPLPLLAAALATVQAPALVKYAGLALDPTGRTIATVDARQPRAAPTAEHGVVVLRDTAGRVVARYDPCPACSYAGLAWSRDGAKLLFVGSANGTATVYALAAGKVRALASVHGLAANPRWSPGGAGLAFLATEDATKETGATQPGVRQVGVIGDKEDSKRIAVMPATGGPYRLVSPAGTFVYEYDWLPDGSGFVGTAAEGNGDNQWWVASLRRFPLHAAMSTIAAPKVQMNFPRVSPDGKTVAFIGGLMSDFGSVGGDVYTVPLAGGTPADVTPGAKLTFTSLAWTGQRLMVGVTQGGSTGLATLDPSSRALTGLAVAPETTGAGDGTVSVDAAGTLVAYEAESFTVPPHIAFGPPGQAKPIAGDNGPLELDRTVAAHDVRWRSGGFEVQGWLLQPVTMVQSGDVILPTPTAMPPPRSQPMITVVHGGPSAAVTPHFPWGDTVDQLARAGYWVFQANPRGSYGGGEAFTRANVKDFGGGDLSDILAGIDAVEKQYPIDDNRLGLFGHSYGGFMTMWTVPHSQRFKAAVAGAGIADWVAYYGQNGIDQWMVPFFGATAYDDPKVYDRLSPIRTIRNARTPTLIYVGERDVECPPAQSLEYWHGLKAVGVPTELVIYADEGHGIRKPADLTDLHERMVGWFDRYLKHGS